MNEQYLGDKQDREFIECYLNNIRSLDPKEISPINGAIDLAELGNRSDVLIDTNLFQELVQHSCSFFASRFKVSIETFDPRRYIVNCPSGDDVGGFHSSGSIGFQYYYNASVVALVNVTRSRNVELRTLELVRNYLHDCLHAMTFRSFRRHPNRPKTSQEGKRYLPTIYREQYGINFRNADGIGYSSAALTERVPHAINLNLLMDGIVVILTYQALASISHLPKITPTSEIEHALLADILLEAFPSTSHPRAHKFNESVVTPTSMFLKHWGYDEMLSPILHGMITGDLAPAKNLFAMKKGDEAAWENTFRQASFVL